ncbi:MAG: tRNA (guanosine(37)-N1)-methyltransferase TrmD [Treponema sp.]|jgi:tRNA (guanine37-N1)-methyltransferase|nr:tRNA (guanosine(37)-N1)-methyltransferase TrmD [Treponema sp.]
MKFSVLTLFPEIIDAYFAISIVAKALSRGILEYQAINIRDFAADRHHSCDDAPYGGGPGMLMLPEPLSRAIQSVTETSPAKDRCLVYLTPSGKPFTQEKAAEFSRKKELILLCGRYEGIDQRIIDLYVDEEVSLGDYVLSSGEVAALTVIDTVYRLVDGVITPESLAEESFSGGLLEYPQYTRPEIFATLEVPGVLLSGHHEYIRRWRLKKRIEKTLANRPDLIAAGLAGRFDAETVALVKEGQNERDSGN